MKTIHINRCPAISPLVTLTDDNALRLGLDKDLCREHLIQLQQASGIVEKIVDAYLSHQFTSMTDPDFMLYQGEFFGRSDVAVMAELRSSKPERLADFEGQFQDDRLDEMLFRYRARNYPEPLDVQESVR